MNRPKVDESKCFICQDATPTHKLTRDFEEFNVCKHCADAIVSTNNALNNIKKALYATDTRRIFQYTIGASLMPVTITVTKLEE